MSLINQENITDYIPQRAPIVMVSSLESISEDWNYCETTFQIKSDNIFVENGFLNESGLVENMAQSAALKAGYFYNQRSEAVPIGFIGKIINLKVLSLPAVGSSIRTTIKETMRFGPATVVEAKVFYNDELLAETQINIYTQQ